MIIHRRKQQRKRQRQRIGRGLLNDLINKLPIELHLPGGYQYCGPGTKLKKRLARGDPGINPLDKACKEHDIAYSHNRENIEARHAADRVLADRAWERVFAKDANIGEKAAAYAVTNAMKLKTKFGLGVSSSTAAKMLKKIRTMSECTGSKEEREKTQKRRKSMQKTKTKTKTARKTATKKKTSRRRRRMKTGGSSTTLSTIVKAASNSVVPSTSAHSVIASALKGARDAVRRAGGRSKVLLPRILPVPTKVGGFLPFLIPLFAGLSAAGAVAGGAAGVAKAINDAKAAKLQLQEKRRHNEKMEAIALGKGLYLKPHRAGLGLRFKPASISSRGNGLARTKRRTQAPSGMMRQKKKHQQLKITTQSSHKYRPPRLR